MPTLVKLAIVRQKNFRDDTQKHATMDDDAAIIEVPLRPERCPDDKNREELGTRADQPIDLPHHLVEHRVLEQEIVDRIGRKTEFREHHQGDPRRVALREQVQDILGVAPRLGDRDMRHAGAEANELMAVGREKRRHSARGSRDRWLRESGQPASPR